MKLFGRKENATPYLSDGLQFDPSRALKSDFSRHTLVDVRDAVTAGAEPIDFLPHIALPMDVFTFGVPSRLKPDGRYLVCCYHGNSSLLLTRWLREQGLQNVWSIVGGYELLRRLSDMGHWDDGGNER
jgi:rhodanese-related sulfurtransferase